MRYNLLSGQNALTANERFGAMAALTPQTILCKIERYYPAASSVEAATAPSRRDVVRKRGRQCSRTKIDEN
jgi:hypothetical protein